MKIIKGIVSSINDSSVKIKYSREVMNKKYGKKISLFSHVIAHSDFKCIVGDAVEAISCAPISKTKKYKVFKGGMK